MLKLNFCVDLKSGVHYVIIGGHAVYHYGYKRIVGDLDLIIDNSCTNIHKFLQVIEDINMKLNNGMRSKLCEPNIKVNIPLFNFPFRELFDNKIIIIFEGLKVSMISRDHLLRMKRESTRAEDQHDYVKLLSIEEKT